MLFIAITFLGYISYKHLPLELIPNTELPFLFVFIRSRVDVDPHYIESQAIIPLEGAIGMLEGIDEIESFASQSYGTIIVYYNQNTKLKYAYLKLQEQVNAVRSILPEEFIVSVQKFDTGQLTNRFMDLQVRGSGGLDRIRHIVSQKIKRELENIDGISGVEVSGGREKSIEITLDDEACRAYGITAAQIRNLITNNQQSNTFVGQAFDDDKRYFVNVIAEYTDVHDLENIIVNRQGPVLLKDISDIYFGVKEQTSISRVNGKESVSIRLGRDAQVNLIALSRKSRAVIDRLNDDLKFQDIEIVIQNDEAEPMERNIALIIRLALIGGFCAVVILWMFLRNLRLVLIIALAIPISIFTAFNFFYAFGISINILTLIGIALAVGMLLDNSVVVLENIYRLVSHRIHDDRAVIQGTREVSRSIIAATLTTITVFLPFIFSSNFILRLVGRHIAVSIISTLLVSLVVALLLIPMITHYLLQRGRKGTPLSFKYISQQHRMLQIYRLLLKSTLRFPARTVVGASVIFFVSVFICLALSLNISREVELNQFTLYVTMPRGSTLEHTDAVVSELEKRLEGIEEKQEITSNIQEESATVRIELKDDYQKINNRNIAQIKGEIQKVIDAFRVAEVSFSEPRTYRGLRGRARGYSGARLQSMFGIGPPVERVVIKGNDFQRMRSVASDIKYQLDNLAAVQLAQLNISGDRPEIHLLFDTQLLSYYDISLSALATELSTFQTEFSSGSAFNYGSGVDEYDIVIREKNPTDKNIYDLRHLPILGPSGAKHELQQLSRIIYSQGMSGINRVNQEKQIEISYQFVEEVKDSKSLLETSRAEVDNIVAGLKIPAGIAVETIHEEGGLEEFYFLIGAAAILIYMILASVFESVVTPIVMMFAIPLAATGAFWALILTKNSLFNYSTMIGLLILLGIVVNNGIILIDYTGILRRRGYRRSRALLMAGQARLRPILITAITTIVAMIPLAMGKVEYAARLGAPFAITVIGGLALGTLFTLVFIPAVYSGLEATLAWMRSLTVRVKLIQLAAFIVGCWLIYTHIDSLVWKLLALVSVVKFIPGLTYFIMSSLRRAQAEYIRPNEPITITVRNVVKIYDRESRFVREWKKGKQIQERVRESKIFDKKLWLDRLAWQLPLFVFMIYFVYFYIRSSLWLFVLVHGVYFYTIALWKPIRSSLLNHLILTGTSRHRTRINLIDRSLFWGFPLFNLIIFYARWKNIALVLFIAAIWYVALLIYATSNRIHRERIDINRLSGRFAGLRRHFYLFVQLIPIIGKKKVPVKALDGVSVEIERGMFGLVGPNGAGKTTLMRIICGILEQSYGKIWINGIDATEKREELQGLIGYLPQEFGVYENMTAYEFLSYQAMMKNILDKDKREKTVNDVLSAVHIEEHKHQKIGSFSGGMKQRIGIAQTLLHLPRILVVDEPTAGLDPRERIRFRNMLVELSRERVVIFSTHIIEDISTSCNQVAVLNEGKLCYLGLPTKMIEIAEGVVWQFLVYPEEFEPILEQNLVVHHMRVGERIRVRCLSDKQPHENAQSVRPTLEDAYLWLLRKQEYS